MKCVVVRTPDLWSGLDQAEPGGTYPRPVVGIRPGRAWWYVSPTFGRNIPGRAWWYVSPTCGRDLTRQSLVVRTRDLWSGHTRQSLVVRIPDLWSGRTRQSLVIRTRDLWSGLDQAEPGGTYPRPVVGTYPAKPG